MKFLKYVLLFIAGAGFSACSDMDDVAPNGHGVSSAQLSEVVTVAPDRAAVEFNGMFTMMGKPCFVFPSANRSDDFGFIMAAISQDNEGPDLVFPQNDYNWFSACGELSTRNPTYSNLIIRYSVPYMQISAAHNVMKGYIDNESRLYDESFIRGLSPEGVNRIAQCLAVRAFDYLSLAPEFQFSYAAGAKDLPCVPLVTLSTSDFSHNPRATVAEVYNMIIKDLTWAIAHLDDYRKSKMYINKRVAYGLRARAYLATEQWALAAEDADSAQVGFMPASISDVSVPSFCDIRDGNWMWGYDMTPEIANVSDISGYSTHSSWLVSLSGKNSYACEAQCYAMVNKILYDRIPSSDVRKGWWVDASLHSDLLSSQTWAGAKGDDIAKLRISDVKEVFLPYTNVKFGASIIPTLSNDADFPFMRVEEMILIEVEGLAKSGSVNKAKSLLADFVRKYRNPQYEIPAPNVRTFEDEIWFQRRVELWGEGFSWSDIMRLNKPLVRFHEGEESNQPDAYRFNLPANDPWLLLRFPQSETNVNLSVVNNEGGSAPVSEQYGKLLDGVTDVK